MLEIVIMGNAHFEYFVYFSPCRVHSAQISSFNILYKCMKIRSRVIIVQTKKKKKKKRTKFEIHYFDGFRSYGIKEIAKLDSPELIIVRAISLSVR